MAVPEQTPYIEHTGNGATTSFALKFQCESKDHLIVLVDEVEPPIATWSLVGGNVVFTTAPAVGKKITLQRNTPFGRTIDYQSFNNSFRPQSVNGDFDRLWLKLQELGVGDWLLKLYVDRLHQQQEQKINDLKSYVDDRDDELRAYLMEEIRKQGVALDQLDEYYNYLMQRIAQIAVDKGWDASFVVDGDKTQKQLNSIFRSGKLIDTRLYGLRVDTDEDQTAAIHAAFTANPNCNSFYIPKGVIKANIVYPRAYIKLVGDGLLNTIIEPFDLTKPAISFDKKLYPGLLDLGVQADQTYTCEQLIDARDTRYKYFENVDVKKIVRDGQTHQYQTILIDDRCVVQTWTGYNKFKNVRGTYGAYGYLSDVDKLNSVPEFSGCLFAFNGYFNIKTRTSNGTFINIDNARGGMLQPAGTYDETQYGGMYIHGNNSVILGIWEEFNAQASKSYNPNNLYIHPESSNITHNYGRDVRGSNGVRVYNQSQFELQNVNTADQALDDGQGRSRPMQLAKNGMFKYWDSALNRPKGWNGYFSGTWSMETSDLPRGYTTGLKVVSNVSGICGIYQHLYNQANLANSYIKDLSKWIGREISVTLIVKNIGTLDTAIRAGISTDTSNIYFQSGIVIAVTEIGKFQKINVRYKVNGTEPRIAFGCRVAGIGEGFIVTGFSVSDDVRVTDAQPVPVTEDGGIVYGTIDAQEIVVTSLTVGGTPIQTMIQNQVQTPSATTVNLTSISHPINTTGKYPGKPIYNSTDQKMYFATGATPASTWKTFDNATTITPV